MLPRSRHGRPRFTRRKSSHGSLKSDSGDEESDIKHVDVVLDDRLPTEYVKQDIIKLAHDLHIPGWSSVTLDMAEDLNLTRITGACTNAIYSVKAPSYVKENIKREYDGRPYHHRIPQRLLLRVYGPQVGLLIDRESELATVSLLTRNNIGPRLLGTFANGRFEQFLDAKPLLKEELAIPEISRQIAKRMEELHANIKLSPEQRAGGPSVWLTIAKWKIPALERVHQLDAKDPTIMAKVLQSTPGQFFEAIDKLRQHIETIYPPEVIHDMLVFCHNDTQYGNILRIEPPKGSPLMRPQNEHRQLVVIDFEYSAPNVPAYDIANHFCEWMGDYHHPTIPYKIWLDRYPTKEQQMNFINSYVEHGAAAFDEAKLEEAANSLYEQVKLWRPVVSAFWGTWGLVQTPIPSDNPTDLADRLNGQYDIVSLSPATTAEIVDEAEEEFDSMSYAAEKIDLFWKDFRALGLK